MTRSLVTSSAGAPLENDKVIGSQAGIIRRMSRNHSQEILNA